MKTKSPNKVAQDARRKAHFENGGSPRTWSGGNKKFPDNKKASNKKACRSKVDSSCDS